MHAAASLMSFRLPEDAVIAQTSRIMISRRQAGCSYSARLRGRETMRKGAGCRPLRRDAPPYGNVSCHPRVDGRGGSGTCGAATRCSVRRSLDAPSLLALYPNLMPRSLRLSRGKSKRIHNARYFSQHGFEADSRTESKSRSPVPASLQKRPRKRGRCTWRRRHSLRCTQRVWACTP